jgi:hypothetical protein
MVSKVISLLFVPVDVPWQPLLLRYNMNVQVGTATCMALIFVRDTSVVLVWHINLAVHFITSYPSTVHEYSQRSTHAPYSFHGDGTRST